MCTNGFTLVEILIVATLLTAVSLLGLTALRSSGTSVNLSRAQSLVQQDARAVLSEMTRELEMAAKADRDDIEDVAGLRIVMPVADASDAEDVDAAVIREMVFQRPTADDPDVWTLPITYRFVNEDSNKNGLLDPNESDLDLNNRATSVIERLEDIDRDGALESPGERRIVGSAQTITDVEFAFDGNVLTVAVEATRAVPGTVTAESGGSFSSRTVRCTLVGSIYPLN